MSDESSRPDEKDEIDELIKSAKMFQDIALCSADFIWEINREGKYTFASEGVKRILEYSPEEIVGKSPFDFMTGEEKVVCGKKFEAISAKKERIVDLRNWNLTKSGKKVCLLTNGVPVLDEMGQLAGYRGMDKDITVQIEAEETLRKRNAELENLNKMMIGREIKMTALKKRVEELEKKLGKGH